MRINRTVRKSKNQRRSYWFYEEISKVKAETNERIIAS